MGEVKGFNRSGFINEEFQREVREKKTLVNSCRANNGFQGKEKKWDQTSAFQKRPSEPEQYSELKVAALNVLKRMEDEKLEQYSVRNYSGMILEIIRCWPELADDLIRKRILKKGDVIDSDGKYWFSVPWLIMAIRKNFPELLSQLNGGKKEKNITDEEIRKNVSSIFSSIRNSFCLFGLVVVQQKREKNAIFYQFNSKLFSFSLEEVFFLFSEGSVLLKKVKSGELTGGTEKIPFKKIHEKKGDESIKMKTIMVEGTVIESLNVMVISGKIKIDISYK